MPRSYGEPDSPSVGEFEGCQCRIYVLQHVSNTCGYHVPDLIRRDSWA